MKTEGRQEDRKQQLVKRFQRKGYDRSHRLEWAYDEETGKYKPGVWEEMREYKERLVTEKLEDEDFKRDLEAARESLREAKGRRDAAWESLKPLREKKRQEEIAKGYSDVDYSELWARYVEANDAYSKARREAANELCAKHTLNLGWVSWLDHCLKMGENEPDKLKLYSQQIKKNRLGGSYIQTDIYFPLSRRMLEDVAYWIEFEGEKAFGGYYQQVEGGGPSTIPDYDRYFEWWKQSDFDPEVKNELTEEYLAPIIEDFISQYRKQHGGKPSKRDIQRGITNDRRAFRKALDYRRKQDT